jgi:hypothetical protein
MGRGKDGFSKIFGERRGTTVVPETESIDPEDALAEAHHARGVDAAVSLKLLGVEHGSMFGLVDIF